ncbi:MAG TPA: hypothetical protein VGW34_08780 [Allosphingosinicella sp.]|nr:hypothetical protein [Allosphingosinicella sp.]
MTGERKWQYGSLGAIVVIAAVLAAAAAAGGGAAQARQGAASAAIERGIDREGQVVTPQEQAMIRARCGDRDGSSFHLSDGMLVCANGRRVDDPEMQALGERIADRAEARVEAAMSRPDVVAALDGEATARMGERMRRFDAVERPRIEAALRRAEARIGRIDGAAIDARVQAALAAARVELAGSRLTAREMARMRADLARARAELNRIDAGEIRRKVREALDRELSALRDKDELR